MASVKLPPNLNLQSESAASEFKFWLQLFEDYMVAVGKNAAEDKVKLSLLRNMMGPEAARILQTLPIKDENAEKYTNVIDAIKLFVSPQINNSFERFKFNERKQRYGEPFEMFLTNCRELIKTCEYNVTSDSEPLENQILRDKIVHGVYDKAIQENLLRIENLTLEKAIHYCRTSEQSKKQVQQMNTSTAVEVDVLKKTINNTFSCMRCQKQHGPRQCPAFGKRCSKCGILNHFAVSCRKIPQHAKKVKEVKFDEKPDDTSSSEELFCGMTKFKDTCSNDWLCGAELGKKSF
ncbi:unnamed protein product [Arctia plantaginis]|uniref:CCHC-type domain-containing protein n=1 Tax=Arctia plantaginis TaxID=874455 RepID=A0A8S0Z7Q7_ARCPL|nr:unnamed protein product [Arctia plantaginis]